MSALPLFARTLSHTVRFPLFEKSASVAPAPLVLFLHGAGEKGEDGAALAASPTLATIKQQLGGRATLVAPQCPPGPGWHTGDLETLLDALLARPDTDRTAVHLTGISMGARGAWDLAYRRAGDFASITAVCGFGVPTLAPLLTEPAIRLYHGDEDAIVPPERSVEMAGTLLEAGAICELRLLPATGHDCGEAVYGDPELWTWLLAQRRKDNA